MHHVHEFMKALFGSFLRSNWKSLGWIQTQMIRCRFRSNFQYKGFSKPNAHAPEMHGNQSMLWIFESSFCYGNAPNFHYRFHPLALILQQNSQWKLFAASGSGLTIWFS